MPPENPENPPGRLGNIRQFFTGILNRATVLRGQARNLRGFLLEKLKEFPKYISQYFSAGNLPIENPKTAADFRKNLDIIVRECNLGESFGIKAQFLQKIAERAVSLKKDPDNSLNSPEQISDLMRLAVYQPVLYCDDSRSMKSESLIPGRDRSYAMKMLATRMAQVATKALPPKSGKGVHLRFINSNNQYDHLQAGDIDRMQFEATGTTPLGTNLRAKILDPLVYNVIDRGEKLPHPLLILTITDGCPSDDDKFRDEIVQCSRYLVGKRYPKAAISFDLSQIGNDPDATQFLGKLMGDEEIKDVLHYTAEHLDGKFHTLRDNHAEIDGWLLQMLSMKIKM